MGRLIARACNKYVGQPCIAILELWRVVTLQLECCLLGRFSCFVPAHIFQGVSRLSATCTKMCDCFGRADVEIEELPPRYYGGPPVKRISLVRDIDREREYAYEANYTRPRSSTASMRQIEYRATNSNRWKEDREQDRRSQYKSPPNIDYPNSPRFIPLPPIIREDKPEKIQEPKKGIIRTGKNKHSSQPSVVVYAPKRGRKERKYYYEDDESDGDSWAGRSATAWTDESADSWAIRPVKKYADTRRNGRSRSRGKGHGRYN